MSDSEHRDEEWLDEKYNRPDDSVSVPLNCKKLRVTGVTDPDDATNLEIGDILYPQGATFAPSNNSAHPIESGDGRWIGVSKSGPDGDYKGICKIRVDDGLIVDALSNTANIEAEPEEFEPGENL